MLPGSPTSARTLALLGAAALCLALPPAARALDVSVGAPRERDGYVWVDARLADPFTGRIGESLTRGMPATLRLHVELWRRRTAWFDRLENTFEASLRLHRDVERQVFVLERARAKPDEAPDLDSLQALLERPLALPAGRVGPLQAGVRYYVVVSATLRPLSLEDAAEVEDWLSSEGGGAIGGLARLPGALFDTVRNFAGFGDQHARAISDDFDLQTLFAPR